MQLGRSTRWRPGRRFDVSFGSSRAASPDTVRRLLTPGPLLAVVLACVIAAGARWGPDWPAQEFRAWIATHDGFTMWTSRWYGGTALPGYSVLYPLAAAVFGAGLIGVVSVAVATWASLVLAPSEPRRAHWFAVAVAVSLSENLLIGQVPYLMGVAFAMLAVRASVKGSPWPWLAVSAALASLASPLAGASLLLTVPALAVWLGWRRVVWLGAAGLGVGVSALVGGANGPFPFQAVVFGAVALFCVVTWMLAPHGNRSLRCFALCYLAAALILFFVPTAIGGNIARVGKLIALPLAVRAISVPRGFIRRAASTVVVMLAAAWAAVAFVSSAAHGASDPSQGSQYYTGLVKFLRTQNPDRGRVEIPFTREHWESYWVAKEFPIARGWERQTDLLYNAVLYRRLTPGRYLHWLQDNAVSLVALPNVPLDYGGRTEGQLLTRPPTYLHPVWHDQNWQVWKLRGTNPLVRGDATLSDLDAASMSLHFTKAVTVVVKVHADQLWHVRAGSGCVVQNTSRWLVVHALRAGTVKLEAGLSSAADRCN